MKSRYFSAFAGATALVALSTSPALAEFEEYPTVFVGYLGTAFIESVALYAAVTGTAEVHPTAQPFVPAPSLVALGAMYGFSRDQLRYLLLCQRLGEDAANLTYLTNVSLVWAVSSASAKLVAESLAAQADALSGNPAGANANAAALAAALNYAKTQLVFDTLVKVAENAAERRRKLKREKDSIRARILREQDEWRKIIERPGESVEFTGMTLEIASLILSEAVIEALLRLVRENNLLTGTGDEAFAAGADLGELSGPDLVELVKRLCAEWERADNDLANIERIRQENIEELQRLNAAFEAAGRAAQASTSPDAQLDVMDAFERLSNHEVSSALYERAVETVTERSRQWKTRKDEAIAKLEKTVIWRPTPGSGTRAYSFSPDAASILRSGINDLSGAWLAALEQKAVIEALDKIVAERGQAVEESIAERQAQNGGSITSVQAVYVPSDELTDPAPANTFTHLDSTVVLNPATGEPPDETTLLETEEGEPYFGGSLRWNNPIRASAFGGVQVTDSDRTFDDFNQALVDETAFGGGLKIEYVLPTPNLDRTQIMLGAELSRLEADYDQFVNLGGGAIGNGSGDISDTYIGLNASIEHPLGDVDGLGPFVIGGTLGFGAMHTNIDGVFFADGWRPAAMGAIYGRQFFSDYFSVAIGLRGYEPFGDIDGGAGTVRSKVSDDIRAVPYFMGTLHFGSQ